MLSIYGMIIHSVELKDTEEKVFENHFVHFKSPVGYCGLQ